MKFFILLNFIFENQLPEKCNAIICRRANNIHIFFSLNESVGESPVKHFYIINRSEVLLRV